MKTCFNAINCVPNRCKKLCIERVESTVHNLRPYGVRPHAAFDNEIYSRPHVI